MLQHDQEVAICRVECAMLVHILARSKDIVADPLLASRITTASHKMERVNPVDRLIYVERIPPQLIRDLVYLFPRFVLWVGVECTRFAWLEI